jgi:DNA-binding MarR family transcriptional regulator
MNYSLPNHGDGQQLLTMLRHAAGVVENRLERAVEARGLSLAKLGVLHALAARGGSLPLGRLADSLSCVRSNITQLVDRLEVDGLVRREPDPADRRSTLATITEEGRRRYEAASRAQDEAEREILGTMPAEQRQQLAALLHEIGTAIE